MPSTTLGRRLRPAAALTLLGLLALGLGAAPARADRAGPPPSPAPSQAQPVPPAPPQPPPPPRRYGPDPAATYAVPIAGAPWRGNADAKVTIVMFGEFKCPYCARAYGTLKALEQQYGADVRIVFHHMIVHQTARPLARVGAAAADQGLFWEYADRVWTGNWRDLDEAGARQIALDVGCKADVLDAYLASGMADSVVDDDVLLAQRFRVSGTPAFFINGRPLSGAQPADKFTVIIDAEIPVSEAWLAAQPAAPAGKESGKRAVKVQKGGKKGKGGAKRAVARDPYDRVMSQGLASDVTSP